MKFYDREEEMKILLDNEMQSIFLCKLMLEG